MKRCVPIFFLLMILFAVLSPSAKSAESDIYADSIEDLKNSLSDEVNERLNELGLDDIYSISDISLGGFFGQISDIITGGISAPLSSCAVMVFVIILSSLLEGYTFSLRYTETREMMSAVSSLLMITAVIKPMISLISSAVRVITDTSGFMLLFFPIMAGLMIFSGRAVEGGSYYITVMTASQVISQLSSRLLAPMLSAYTGLAVSAGVSLRIRLSGICDMLSGLIKWSLVFVMSIYTAVLSLQTAAASAADTVASRAIRFTLSSFIPIIGSAVSDAYKSIQSGVNVLRSGAGIFAIAAIMVSFLPVIIQAVLWKAAISFSRRTARILATETGDALLSSLNDIMGVIIALSVTVMAVFVISAGALMSIGGGS